jgi:hypothetical protein
MLHITEILGRLRKSKFRRRFHLDAMERQYLERKGARTVLEHAADFVAKRLAPAQPANDGKQTPWRGHPVFVAQHATATCCRGCLEKWHGIAKGREMTGPETDYVVAVIGAWLSAEAKQSEVARRPQTETKDLFGFGG